MNSMRGYMAATWNNMWKLNSDELKSKAIGWRTEHSIHRIERPSRLDRARKLGYKAKQGIIMVRARVGRGGMRKQRPVSGISMQHVAERRVLKNFPNMESLGSYYLHKDGRYLWYEVILADPYHPSISHDKEMRRRLKTFAKNSH